jgi:hypothetical protein
MMPGLHKHDSKFDSIRCICILILQNMLQFFYLCLLEGDQLIDVLAIGEEIVVFKKFCELCVADEEEYLEDIVVDPLAQTEVVLEVVVAAF